MSEMCCKRCGANENRLNGFCSTECEEYYRLEEEIEALERVILARGAEIRILTARIAELEAYIDQLIELGEWGVTGMEIVTSFKGGEIHDLAERRQNEWLTLVKDWKERER